MATARARSIAAKSLILSSNAAKSPSSSSNNVISASASCTVCCFVVCFANVEAKRAAWFALAVAPSRLTPPSIAAPLDPIAPDPCLAAITRRSSSPYVRVGCWCWLVPRLVAPAVCGR